MTKGPPMPHFFRARAARGRIVKRDHPASSPCCARASSTPYGASPRPVWRPWDCQPGRRTTGRLRHPPRTWWLPGGPTDTPMVPPESGYEPRPPLIRPAPDGTPRCSYPVQRSGGDRHRTAISVGRTVGTRRCRRDQAAYQAGAPARLAGAGTETRVWPGRDGLGGNKSHRKRQPRTSTPPLVQRAFNPAFAVSFIIIQRAASGADVSVSKTYLAIIADGRGSRFAGHFGVQSQ